MAVRLDEIDRAIVMLLQDNARMSFAEIARRLKIGESKVRFRVRRLEKMGVITKFMALVDPRKVGLPITGILMLKIDPAHLDAVLEKLVLHKYTHHVFKSTGECDCVVIVHARDTTHLNELVKRIKMLPGVRDVLVSIATALIKIKTRLEP